MKAAEPEEEEERNLDERVQLWLEILDMKKYYPQKLTYEDVIKLKSEDFDDVSIKCTDFHQLPWYFMNHIISIDSDTRESCHIEDNNMDGIDDSSSDDSEDESVNDVNRLDLIYIVFLCADDFLRQELIEKMIQCQYAVPFILPSAVKMEDKPKTLVLRWALQKSTKTFYQNNVVVNKPLMNVKAPLITCVSIGEETSWKSRLLNKMLSPQQETFWHQGLRGGSCKQVVSRGMVELAWYLAGKNGNGILANPLMFANVRQSTRQSDTICDALLRLSSVSCVFTEDVDEELSLFLEKRNISSVIIIMLHRKDQEKWMKKRCKELQTNFKLEKHQIIRKTAEDANFSIVEDLLRKSITQVIRSPVSCISLSNLVTKLKDLDNLEIDSERSYFPQMATNSILRDIDQHNNTKQGSAKVDVLPFQSDMKTRQQDRSIG